ncbi:PIG-L family deacetylase [Egibacter rhizosphaerae]|uniref:PIG-L family deacetylase n=1 Tax=Egibacter rhizosphaerae TaxID=1670831 RepID=A0A411YCE6_9ACTN|nr:PIG-L deacetylase family protein [Egibacter rhizosphaerae]QBI18923.1 PIG-L family deacetylase [Egibacter rhizosphaerae]
MRIWEPERPFRRALVVVAHPDDAEFGAAGTIGRWVADGTEVRYLVMTDGASGSQDPGMSRGRLAAIREAEQRAACARLGVAGVQFGGWPDGYLEPDVGARRYVASVIRQHQPEVVLTLNPLVRWTDTGRINHPDHRAVGDLVLHCINPAASTRLWDTSLLDDGLEPWDVSEVWLASPGDPAFADQSGGDLVEFVDIADTFGTKLAALRCHESQLGETDPEPRVRGIAAERGAAVGRELVEPFTILRQRDLAPLPPV